MELSQAQKIFLMSKKSEGLTTRSMQSYTEATNRFYGFLMDNGVYTIEDITAFHVRSFLLALQEKGLKGVTRHRYFRIIRTLCQRRIKFDRNAGWKLTHFAGGLKRRILLTPVRVSPVYPWWRYQPVAQSLSQLLTYPLICKFRREY